MAGLAGPCPLSSPCVFHLLLLLGSQKYTYEVTCLKSWSSSEPLAPRSIHLEVRTDKDPKVWAEVGGQTCRRGAQTEYLSGCCLASASGKIGGWDTAPNTQYHIQTDEGPERYFRYQTSSGQYRKEKRLQDGSVVGTYGWVDADGFLRLRDYIADDKGYRIVRTKMVRVGQVDSRGVEPTTTTTTTTPRPITLSEYLREKAVSSGGGLSGVEVAPNGLPAPDLTTPELPATTPGPEYIRPTTYRPSPNALIRTYQEPYSEPAIYEQPYDGIALTQNGFRYYLPRHYHEEESSGDRRAGSFGYVDPFGIRRVIYYNTAPGTGFVHRKNNRYVGFRSTPYDPRF